MSFVDFAALKERVRIEDVLPMLGLEMREQAGQWRGPCPACNSGGNRALVITPAKAAFYCFGGRTGGDVIALDRLHHVGVVVGVHALHVDLGALVLDARGQGVAGIGIAAVSFDGGTTPQTVPVTPVAAGAGCGNQATADIVFTYDR